MIFNEAGRLVNDSNFYCCKAKLDIVKTYCYLGVEFTCSGSFKCARDCFTDKAQKAMFSLKALINQFQLPIKNSLRLFHSLIKPIALYNSENLVHLSHRQISDLEENRKSLSECVMNSHKIDTRYKIQDTNDFFWKRTVTSK